jgi:2-polyprenyl-3-methyl-5-hydroxy-6-metoxy-1,4-benzoquinol methylase
VRYAALYHLVQRVFTDRELAVQLLHDSVGYTAGLRILDVGCGTGLHAGEFADADYLGIDVSERYLAAARHRHPNKTFVACQAEQVGSLGRRFDRAIVMGVFHHLPDEAVRQSMRALGEVIEPGGSIYITEAVWPESRLDFVGYLLRRLDRGKFVRSRRAWLDLLAPCGELTDRFYYHRRLPCLEMTLRVAAATTG